MGQIFNTNLYKDANFQAYYRAENTSDSKGSNTLTNNNSVAFTACKYNNGFDGGSANTNKYMSTSSVLNIDGGACAISLWVLLNAEIGSGFWDFTDQVNNTSKTEFTIRYEFNGGTRRIVFQRNKIGGTADSVALNITLGILTIHHIVLTYDGVNIGGYVDNVSAGTAAASGSGSGTSTQGFGILADPSGSNPASAIVDEIGVWNRGLLAAEVDILFKPDQTGGLILGQI